MAAREDQAETVVFDVLIVSRRVGSRDLFEPASHVSQRRALPSATTNCIDGLESARRNEPTPGIGGHSLTRPLLKSRRGRRLQPLLGQVEVAEQTNQRRQDSTRFRAIELVEQ